MAIQSCYLVILVADDGTWESVKYWPTFEAADLDARALRILFGGNYQVRSFS